ncbi:MAG: hypothetical protein ACI4UA_07305 [Bacteroidaceae bacterium]
MKKGILITLVILTCLTLCYICFVGRQIDHYPQKIWLHRCNSIEKLNEKEARYPNVEVDICLRADGVMDVTHDIDTTFHLNFIPYLEYLSRHPERHIWIDIKNLSEDNVSSFKRSLDSLVYTYKVSKDQLIIESPQWLMLYPFTSDFYYTSCYVTAPRPSTLTREQRDSVISRLGAVTRSGCVRALSFPAYWYNSLRFQFKDREIDYLTWMNHRTQFGMLADPLGQVMMRDSRVKVILVKDKGRYHR